MPFTFRFEISANTGNTASEINQVSGELREVQRESNDASRSLDRVGSAGAGIGKLAAGIGLAAAAFAAAEIGAFVSDSLDAADAMADLAKQTGVAVEDLSVLKFAANQNGIEFEKLQGALLKTAKLTEAAGEGNKKANKTLTDLGFSAKEVSEIIGSNAADAFSKIRDKLAELPNGSEKAALALETFGKSGGDLLPIFDEGSQSIGDYKTQLEGLGGVLSGELAAQSDQFNDNLSQIKIGAQGLANSFLSDLLPSFNDYYAKLSESGATETFTDGIHVLGGVVKGVAVGVIVLKNAFDILADGAQAAIESITGPGVVGKAQAYFKNIGDTVAYLADGEGLDKSLALARENLVASIAKIQAEAKPIEISVSLDKNLSEITSALDSALLQTSGTAAKVQSAIAGANGRTTKGVIDNAGKAAGADEASAKRRIAASKQLADAQARDAKQREQSEAQMIEVSRRREAEITKLIAAQKTVSEESIASAQKQLQYAQAVSEADRQKIRDQDAIASEVEKSRVAYQRQNGTQFLTPEQEAELKRHRTELEGINEQTREQQKLNEKRAAEANSTYGVVGNAQGGFDQIQGFADLFSQAVEDGFDQADFGAFFGRLKDGFSKLSESFGGGVGGAVGAAGTALSAFADLREIALRSDGNAAGSVARALTDRLAQSGNPYAVAVAAIDRLAGGRIFGTDFTRQSQGYNVAVGAGGVTGGQFAVDTRQRALFGGTARRTTNSALDNQIQQSFDQLFESIQVALSAGALRLGVVIDDVVTGAFRQVTDKNGKITEQYGTILGRRINGDAQAFSQALFGENLIALIEKSSDQAQAIADRWRGTTAASAAAIAEGAQFLFDAQADIVAGNALLSGENDLTRIADLIEALDRPGETLAQTYARVAAASNILESAVDFLGSAFESGTEEFVNFAAGIVDAAGGLETASNLFDRFFSGFFSDTERADVALQAAIERRNALATGLNLDSNISASALRHIISNAIESGIDPQQVVRLLTFADAVLDVTDAQANYNETLRETQDELDAASEALQQARTAYASFTSGVRAGLNEEANTRGLSEYNNSLQRLGRETQGQIDQANQLAQAAGLAGASSADLTDILRAGALRMADAAQALEARLAQTARRLFKLPEEIVDRSLEAYLGRLANPPPPRADPVAAQRFADLSAFAADVRSLAEARQESVFGTLDRLIVPLEELITGLGVNLSDLANDSADFVSAARQLGLELPDLATQLGVSVGTLEDVDSILNNAFENLIRTSGASKDDQAQIFALLRAVEGATTADGRTAAVAALEAFINSLPAQFRTLFAPVLEGVDTTSFQDDSLDRLDTLNRSIEAGNLVLNSILTALSVGRPIAKGLNADDGTLDSSPQKVSDERAISQLEEVRLTIKSGLSQVVATLDRGQTELAAQIRELSR